MQKMNDDDSDCFAKPQYIRAKQLKTRLGISASSLWSWVKNKKFPKPVELSENITAWRISDVLEWEQEKQNQRKKDK